MAELMEQGFTWCRRGEGINDACRRVNEEGWNVKQVLAIVNGEKTSFGVLVERPFNQTSDV